MRSCCQRLAAPCHRRAAYTAIYSAASAGPRPRGVGFCGMPATHGPRSSAMTATTVPTGRAAGLPQELLMELPLQCQVPAATVPLLHQVLEHYADRTPRLHAVLERVTRPGWPGAALGHDHYAFRTFGVPGLGIASLERLLLPLGYIRVESDPPLAFPGKKLLAAWFSPADPRVRAVLPRVFVSELQVEKLSRAAQDIIREATGWAAGGGEGVTVQIMSALLTGTAPWAAPSLRHYEALMAESEYAAWVLAHGYSLNHTALALHRLPATPPQPPQPRSSSPSQPQSSSPPPAAAGGSSGSAGPGPGADIADFVSRLQGAGLDMNAEGGLVKVSPDGLLLQCAVVADRTPFTFACGGQRDIAAAYVEFVQRLRLPQYAGLQAGEVREEHLREGFEVGNADRIFESTTLAATAAATGANRR